MNSTSKYTIGVKTGLTWSLSLKYAWSMPNNLLQSVMYEGLRSQSTLKRTTMFLISAYWKTDANTDARIYRHESSTSLSLIGLHANAQDPIRDRRIIMHRYLRTLHTILWEMYLSIYKLNKANTTEKNEQHLLKLHCTRTPQYLTIRQNQRRRYTLGQHLQQNAPRYVYDSKINKRNPVQMVESSSAATGGIKGMMTKAYWSSRRKNRRKEKEKGKAKKKKKKKEEEEEEEESKGSGEVC
ncbi:hypothetical protein WN51_14696 [Melipona quadrifasciata]|uniref:Uncharacterized protein n=1 Tax=Melipona quadrifasciata TaxID=166423 RepID=A0A0N0U5M0_9HYME|nr:hypothetical protein WN51_14696 [Melipona quadrifasciata]